MRLRQQPDHVILYLVDVLKLINENIRKLSLPHPADIRTLIQKLITVYKHIIKIQKPFSCQTILIFLVDPSKGISRAIRRIVMSQIHPPTFHPADLRPQIIKEFVFILYLNVRLVHNLLQKLTTHVFPDNITCLIMIRMF